MTTVGGGELFTGNTALVTTALYEKRATVKGLLKVSRLNARAHLRRTITEKV
jgi:formate/nitrite transporter FocA (FNT family)